jgi:hypothetical protein
MTTVDEADPAYVDSQRIKNATFIAASRQDIPRLLTIIDEQERDAIARFDNDMVFYAFRYCLGRQTYAVNDCVNYLVAHWQHIDHIHRIQVQNEIRKHFKRVNRPVEDEWQRVLSLPLRAESEAA